jgi:hypothetical protein
MILAYIIALFVYPAVMFWVGYMIGKRDGINCEAMRTIKFILQVGEALNSGRDIWSTGHVTRDTRSEIQN